MGNCERNVLISLATLFALMSPVHGHHSFAMYDIGKRINFTGVVTRVVPNTSHLAIYIVPLDAARRSVIRDESGDPIEWAIEMYGSAQGARDGITINGFPRGSIISIGLHPLRDGKTAGMRGDSGLFKCPENTPPPRGLHCDSVEGSTAHGPGVMELVAE